MVIKDYGAVCDTSVLTDRNSVNEAESLFNNSGLYIPTSTYSWLSRSKLVQVRKQTVKYTLLKQLVRNRIIYPVHLPELYDELGRQIMFEADRNVALTDLRGLFLSAHLQLPMLVCDDGLSERIAKKIDYYVMQTYSVQASWMAIRNILELYRELAFQLGKIFYEKLKEGENFSKTVAEVRQMYEGNFRKVDRSMKEINEDRSNSGMLEFQYVAWDISSSIEEYHQQKIVEPEIVRQICERSVLLISKAVGAGDFAHDG